MSYRKSDVIMHLKLVDGYTLIFLSTNLRCTGDTYCGTYYGKTS